MNSSSADVSSADSSALDLWSALRLNSQAVSTSPFPAATEFGRRVRIRRLRQQWSQERLAYETGLHNTYIGRVERGEVNLTLLSILRIATALGTDPGTLLRGLEAPAVTRRQKGAP